MQKVVQRSSHYSNYLALLTGAAEYTDCIAAEG